MTIDRNVKIGVATSIIATILFIYLLDPIMRFVGFVLFNYGSTILRAYIDRLFEQAALLTPPDPALAIFTSLLALANGFITGVVTSRFFPRRLFKKLRVELQKKEEPESQNRKRPWVLLVPVIVINLVWLMWSYSTFFQFRIISSFNQHLVAVAPYVSEHDLNLIRSQWTQMQSEKDYGIIYSELGRIANQNHIRLPENLVFSYKNL
jgi:hypothetical protein